MLISVVQVSSRRNSAHRTSSSATHGKDRAARPYRSTSSGSCRADTARPAPFSRTADAKDMRSSQNENRMQNVGNWLRLPRNPEPEDRARPRRLLYDRFDQRRQSSNATPHVGPASQIDPHISRRPNHAASTQAIDADNSSRSASAAILSTRPFLRTMSTSLDLDRRPLLLEPSAGLSGAITETGTNDALFGASNLGGENFFHQAYICWGRISWRRATTETLPSGPNASCNIDSFCSADHPRCRSAPVRISTLAIHTLLRHK